jgi:heme exporter protein A
MRLVARTLACERGGRIVFDALSFAVAGGEALVLTGPNGAGKSSLLRVLAGLLRLRSGDLTLEGGDAELSLSEQCHFAGHFDPVKPALTVHDNLRFWADFLGGAPGQAVNEALDAVGLADLVDLPAGYLSAGQRRRLSLARLLAVHRPVWLLDEPTAALDAAAQARFAALCGEYLRSGGILVAATHAPLRIGAHASLELGLPA